MKYSKTAEEDSLIVATTIKMKIYFIVLSRNINLQDRRLQQLV